MQFTRNARGYEYSYSYSALHALLLVMSNTLTCFAWRNQDTIQSDFAMKKRIVKRFNVVELRQKSTTVLKKVRKLIHVHQYQHNKNAKAPKTSPQNNKTEIKHENILQRSKRKLDLEEKKQMKKRTRALRTQPVVTKEYNVFKHEKIVNDVYAHDIVDSGIMARSIVLSSTKSPAPTPTFPVSIKSPSPVSTKSPSSSNSPSSIEYKSTKIPTISTKAPTESTKMPSKIPTNSPIVVASTMPSLEDSSRPSTKPSFKPSIVPTIAKSSKPSHVPSIEVLVSTKQPSRAPVKSTDAPTITSSNAPSTTMNKSTKQPTRAPIIAVSSMPSIVDISAIPSRQVISTKQPVVPPTVITDAPSVNMNKSTKQPTRSPVVIESVSPYTNPSSRPSLLPSQDKSHPPSIAKSNSPTMTSAIPSVQDSNIPSFQPSHKPSTSPSHSPISKPSDRPSTGPTLQPSERNRSIVTFAPTPPNQIQSVRGISSASKIYISVTTALAAGMVAGMFFLFRSRRRREERYRFRRFAV